MASLRNVRLSWSIIATGGLLFGYIIGLNSNIVTTGQLLCPDDWSGDVGSWTSVGYKQCYQMNAWDVGVFSALSLVGATVSSLICFRLSDWMGRKLEVQISALLYLIGAIVTGVSPALWGVYAGIVVYGLGIGFSMHVAPVYIAEIAPKGTRGAYVSATEIAVVLGIFLGFSASFALSGISMYGWRFSVLVSGVFAVIMQIGIAFIPQSPRFLVLMAVRAGGILGAQDRPMNEAREAMKFFRQVDTYRDIEDEVQEIFEDCSEVYWHSATVVRRVAIVRDAFSYKRPLLIGCGIVFLQQITGQPSVLYFATDIFKDAGFGTWAPFTSVLVGFVKLVATLFSVRFVDRCGRRMLLLLGTVMMAVALAALGTAFLFQECQVPGRSIKECDEGQVRLPHAWAITTAGASMLYVSGYQVGFGTISTLLLSEVFPLNVRGAAISIAVLVNLVTNITMTLTVEVLLYALTPSGLFFAFCGLTLASIIFVWNVIPDTMGKSLEQIAGDMTGREEEQQQSFLDPQCIRSIASVSTVDTLATPF